ncbi:MAG TPA: AIM24 family protein, partial [Promineifilum sp.]|nr:AIM24 family protein [Promineifilum sp.]
MNIELLYRPAFSLGMIHLDGNERVRVEAASMVSMSQGVTLETQATGGFLKSLSRSVLGGQSFFQNT